MKQFLAVLLAVLMLASLAACGAKTETEAGGAGDEITDIPADDVIVGGYTLAESPVVTDEVKAVLAKATEAIAGMDFIPVAYVASQVVAGKNHLILCKAAPVVADPTYRYTLVTVYEDLSGNAEITDSMMSFAEAPTPASADGAVMGGWSEPESPVLTDEAKAALDKATEALTGGELQPIALLCEQLVAGTNYMILCRMTPATQESAPADVKYTVVTVYADLSGNAEITAYNDFLIAPEDTDENSASSQAE